MNLLKKVFNKIYEHTCLVGQSCEHLVTLYSLLTLSGYFLFGLFNLSFKQKIFHNDINLRIISVFLLIILLVYKFVDEKYKTNKFLFYVFWFLTVTINQSFFFSFMMLQNRFNYLWSLNSLISYSFLLIIFGWTTAFILIIFGILAAIGLYYFMGNHIDYSENIPMFISAFVSLLIYGALFSYRRKTQEEMKTALDNLTFQSGAIAHEMRTPLASVTIGAQNIAKIAQHIKEVTNQDLSQKHEILCQESDTLMKISQSFTRIARNGQNFINLLLNNLKQDFRGLVMESLSMQDCLYQALDTYVFKSHEQAKIHVDIQQNFTFEGNKDLIIHIFFNLLKNSLYFIHASHKGEIFITVTVTSLGSHVIFKDTGCGIEPKQLPYIFKPFYSKRPHGTGIGLSFCRKAMESMGGRIDVTSIFGQETVFILYLPESRKNIINDRDMTNS